MENSEKGYPYAQGYPPQGYYQPGMPHGVPVNQPNYSPGWVPPQQQNMQPGMNNWAYQQQQQQNMQPGMNNWAYQQQKQQTPMRICCYKIERETAKLLFRLFMAIAIINFTVGIFTIINNRESSAMSVAVFFLLLAFIFNTDWCGWGGPEKDRTGANGNQQV